MDARDRALWEDAEGSLYVPNSIDKARNPQLRTTQMELGVLYDYQKGAKRDGVDCDIMVVKSGRP